MRKQTILKISGKVQGVFFRDSSRAQAQELNLCGWAKNQTDGTVEIVAEGDDKDLLKFIEWCKYGPDHAEVEKVDVKWRNSDNQFTDFLIK
ncbi:acylphosphatase [Patescibacteria group bacterium]|nr:acylphosphatase [Patescibacteria group bacterium]